MPKTKSGFTIVELLIVIVVIGILAAITIVAYNGFQTRAKNTKTITAAATWVKAIKLYNADTGAWPTTDSCFGTPTTYPGSGLCWNSASFYVNTAFTSALSPYMSGLPEPDTTSADSTLPDRRGAFYDYNSDTDVTMYVMLIGVSSCPEIGGAKYQSTAAASPGRWCNYNLRT